MRHLVATLAMVLFGAGCGSEHGDAAVAPAAPTNLAVSNLSGGGHLTWADNSDNEDHFMIMRKAQDGTYDDIDILTFNSTSYHDASVIAGTTYVYMVMAMNSKGEASSNEVTFTP
jgi:hypothetical protein